MIVSDTQRAAMPLSEGYERDYSALLKDVSSDPRLRHAELNMFWPKIGSRWQGDLLVAGRAVNGWIDRWIPAESPDPEALAATARGTGEDTVNGDQLGWVLEAWQRRGAGYKTSRSQFWETVRRVCIEGRPDRVSDWPSYIAWTNLLKVAPWTGGNPGSRLRAAQRDMGFALLAREIEELNPRRVVVLAGRWWFAPFAEALGLDVRWQDGYVEGIADEPKRRWVIAVHPMTRSPRAVAAEVNEAFESH